MKYRLEPHPIQQAWAASGAISLELSPKPYTITRMAIILRASITTTSATNYNDYWDRIISRLNLTGGGKTFFDFSNLRAAYHFTRFAGFGAPRPTAVGDSATTLVQHIMYVFHFGVAPFKVNPVTGLLEDNPWDLTAGIPPVSTGNLNLGGTFAANSVMGANVTIADADMDIYLWGVQPEAGDSAAAYLPRAYPIWSMRTPTPTATSSARATQDNIPSGDYLHSMLVMATNGSNAPRDDSVLNSFEVFHQLENREIFRYGGQAGVVADVKVAELISAFSTRHAAKPLSDNVTTAMTAVASSTPGVPTVLAGGVDAGLIWCPLYQFATGRGSHPLYGVNMNNVATGDLQARYGVSDATGVTLDFLYRKYQLNPEHPANRLSA